MAPSDPLRMSQYWEQPCQPFYLVLRHSQTGKMCKVLVDCDRYVCPQHGPARRAGEIAAICRRFKPAGHGWFMLMPDNKTARDRMNQRRRRKGGERFTIRRHDELMVALSERNLSGDLEQGVEISYSALVEVVHYEMRMPGLYRVRGSAGWTPVRPKHQTWWERVALVIGDEVLEKVMARMRALYAEQGGVRWPEDEEWPLDLYNRDGKVLFQQAYADVTEFL